MMFSAACSMPPRIALGIAMLSLAACATDGSEVPVAACPPVPAYDAALLERTAAEVEALPEGAVVLVLLADCAVLRNQARACRTKRATY